jgi:hypothetical protein
MISSKPVAANKSASHGEIVLDPLEPKPEPIPRLPMMPFEVTARRLPVPLLRSSHAAAAQQAKAELGGNREILSGIHLWKEV